MIGNDHGTSSILFQERSTITSLLAEMTQEQKDQYSELEATAAALRADAEQARSQVDHLNREKDEFSKEISGSQVWSKVYSFKSNGYYGN